MKPTINDEMTTTDTGGSTGKSVRRLATIAGWIVVSIVAMLLANRYISITQPIPILLAGLTPFLAVPLVFCGLMLLPSRSKALATATVVLTGAYLITVAPHDAIVGCGPEQRADSISVIASNVLGDGATPDEVVAFAREHDPDVLTLAETAYWFLDEVGPALAQQYPYQSADSVQYTNGSVIFSKWPLSNVANVPDDDFPGQSATVASPYGEFTVIAVHTQAPVSSFEATMWKSHFKSLAKVSRSTPTVLAGDFNATEDHKPFRQLLDAGWHDTHDDKGCGLDNTWPTARPDQRISRTVPFMRLDHIVTTSHFETVSVKTVPLTGSDHAAVEAEIVLAPTP